MRHHRLPARCRRDHQRHPGPEGSCILLTHAHNDHIGAAREVALAVGAPIYLNPEDQVLWEQVYPDIKPQRTYSPRNSIKDLARLCVPVC
jgi:glyoxylase-like metal-dependent hydrolase (beta-lactamase superfamily II)